MPNEAGPPASPEPESVPAHAIGQDLPPAPPTVTSGHDWVNVSHRELDGIATPSIIETWQQAPPKRASPDFENPFTNELYVQDLRQRYARQTQHLQHLEGVSRPLGRRLRRLEDARLEVAGLRLRMPTEADNREKHRELVSKFQDAFLQEAEAFLASTSGDQSTDKLRLAYNQATEVRDRHDAVAQYTHDFEARLSLAEAEMQRHEEKVIQVATAVHDVLRQIALPAESGTATVVDSDMHSLVSDSSSEGIPGVVERYFDKLGDLRLEKDKLFDLDQEHRQERVQRQLERDQDRLPERSDEEFEEHWLMVFADAEMAFEKAKERAGKALQACKKRGLDPNDYRKNFSRLPDEAIGTPDLGGGQVDAPTPSTYVHGSSQVVQTPTHQLLFSPLDDPHFGEEQYAQDPPLWLGRRKTKDKRSPLESRVRDWMSTVPAEDQARPRATSEASTLLRIDNFDVPPSWTSERRPSAIRTQRGSQASLNARWTEPEKDKKRTSAIKHSSSESELFVFQSQPSVRSRIQEFWKSGEIRPYGIQPDASLLRSTSMPQATVS